uniref:CSON003067 protein n=1 Tax=Culicoides sonorensis TaxID=179676 RepID=A0A336L0I6_CULSO
MNRILLILIISSGFLLIIYTNNDIFRENVLQRSDSQHLESSEASHHHHHQHRVYHYRRNATEYNLFLIYANENESLKHKLDLFLKSLLKYSSISIHLHVITDDSSQISLENSINTMFHKYRGNRVTGRLNHLYTIYDVNDARHKIKDIHDSLMPLFSYNSGSYYSDPLFLLSLGLHRIVDASMKRGILVDCDIVFRSDAKELFEEFKKFNDENLFGLGPELTPVYRHVLYKYRAKNPNTNFGNPYDMYLLPTSDTEADDNNNSNKGRKYMKHGYPGLNSGVVMLNFDAIRQSKLYEETLKPENIRNLVKKYYFKGHLGDQDFYTLLGYEFPAVIYYLDCIWNRQLCVWWREHGYGEVFDAYFHCESKGKSVKIYHGNCNTRVPE